MNDVRIEVTAAAGWFTTDELDAAHDLISREFRVSGSLLFQASGEPPARIIVEGIWSVLVSLGPNLAASALWDGLRFLLLRFNVRRTERSPDVDDHDAAVNTLPTIEFLVQRPDISIWATVRTDDPEILKQAMATLSAAATKALDQAADRYQNPARPGYVNYEAGSGKWVAPQ